MDDFNHRNPNALRCSCEKILFFPTLLNECVFQIKAIWLWDFQSHILEYCNLAPE